MPDYLVLLYPSCFIMPGSDFYWTVLFVRTVKRWSPEQDGFSVFPWLSCRLCAFCLLCILSTHLCVFLCLFISFLVLALSACFWTIFCLHFAKFHSFSWGCPETGFGPQIYTIQFIMGAKNTFSSWHFEDIYFNLLKMCLGQILHVYTNFTAKWDVPHKFKIFLL